MPFLAEEHYPIPTQDLLSWYFDDPQFDQDKPLYIDGLDTTRFWTANQAKQAIRQLAAGFTAAGLLAGDCVCIASFNDLNYPILVNGIAGFGGVYTGTNPAYQVYEMIHHLRASRARMVVVQPELLQTLLPAAEELGIPRERILIFDNPGDDDDNNNNKNIAEGFASWRTLFEHGERDWPRFDDQKTQSQTTLARLFSSGTTGLPKAAMLSHRNMITQHRLFTDWNGTPWQRRRIAILPMFHAATVPLAHYATLRSGDEMYIVKKFDLEIFLRLIEKHKITEGAFVPPVVNAIINSPLSTKYSLKSIRIAHGGAAPLDKFSQARLKEMLAPDAPFAQVWGMTETSCTCSMTRWPQDDPTGSVGSMLPNMDCKLVDEDGRDISGFDVRGEICVRGPLVFQGYFENPEANKRDFDNEGFFHTGDIAYRDGKSKLWYIVDRKKELIKVKSNQVAPAELEAVLLKNPQIEDAGVIGIPVKTGSGELPRAYVVAKQGSDLTEEEVKAYVAERLASYKRIEGGVVFVDAIPKNASGKILKRSLREQAAEELGFDGKGKAKL